MEGCTLVGQMSLAFQNFKREVTQGCRTGWLLINATDALKRASIQKKTWALGASWDAMMETLISCRQAAHRAGYQILDFIGRKTHFPRPNSELDCFSKPKLHSNREEQRFEACDEVTLKDLDFPVSSWAFYWKQRRDLKENTAQDNQWLSYCGSALPRAPGKKPGLVEYPPAPTGQWWACKRRHRTSPAHVDRNHKSSLSRERFSSKAAKEAN